MYLSNVSGRNWLLRAAEYVTVVKIVTINISSPALLIVPFGKRRKERQRTKRSV